MQQSEKPFAYFLKEPLVCKVTYRGNGEMAEISGTLHLAEAGYDRIVVHSDGEKTEVKVDNVLSISSV